MVLDPELVARLLTEARSTGAEFAEVFAERRSSTSIRLDDGRIEEVVSGSDRGAGIRVFHGETQAYAFTDRLDAEPLLEAARAAASAVRSVGDAPAVVGVAPVPTERYTRDVERPADEVATGHKVAWLREADDAARSIDASVRQVMAGYADGRQQVLVANSDGRWAEEVRTRIRLAVQVVAMRDGRAQVGFDGPGRFAGAEMLDRYPPGRTAANAARAAVAMLNGRPAPAGETAVVIAPGGGGILLHEACGHGLEVDHIHKDASIYQARLGEVLGSPLLTAVDDGTVLGAWGYEAVDDEGSPTQRTVLFEQGRLAGYLYDLRGARRDGVRSTGNGRRQGHSHLPIPRMTNTYILAGDSSAADVIAGTKRGLYAKSLGGGQVNPATGDFVFGVSEGYLIENGEIGHAVSGANLIGNGIGILTAIDAVADDFDTKDGICGKEGQMVPVSNGSPTLRIARMTVGGTDA